MQLIPGFDDTRCVGNDNLEIFVREYGLDPVTGGLHFRGDNSQLLPHQGVQQGAFTGIGPAKNIYESCLHDEPEVARIRQQVVRR